MSDRYFVCTSCWHDHERRDELLELPGVCGFCLDDPEHANPNTPSTGDPLSEKELWAW